MKIPFTQPILESAFTEPFYTLVRVEFTLSNADTEPARESRERFAALIMPGVHLERFGNTTQVVGVELETSHLRCALCITYCKTQDPSAHPDSSGWWARTQSGAPVHLDSLYSPVTCDLLWEMR
jgi:NAD-dependent dihydropyrimidine dehydrogenase PreA subunit